MDAAQAPDIAELNHDLDTIHSILEQDPNNIHPSHEPDSMRDSDKPTDGDKQHLSDVAASSGPVEPPANDPKEDFAPSSTNQQVVKIEILEDEDLDMIVPRYEKVELDPTKSAEFDTSPSLDHPMAHPVVSAGVQNVEGIRQVAAPMESENVSGNSGAPNELQVEVEDPHPDVPLESQNLVGNTHQDANLESQNANDNDRLDVAEPENRTRKNDASSIPNPFAPVHG